MTRLADIQARIQAATDEAARSRIPHWCALAYRNDVSWLVEMVEKARPLIRDNVPCVASDCRFYKGAECATRPCEKREICEWLAEAEAK